LLNREALGCRGFLDSLNLYLDSICLIFPVFLPMGLEEAKGSYKACFFEKFFLQVFVLSATNTDERNRL